MTKIHTWRDIPDELVDVLKKDGIAMVDCEFTGLDVGKKGTDRLCLIQICNKESKEVYLVQPNKNFETPNLVKVLNDPNIQIVIHFARHPTMMSVFFFTCILSTTRYFSNSFNFP